MVSSRSGHGKINTDGAVRVHERRAGAGVVARDHTGAVVGAMAVPLPGLMDPLIVEAMAMLRGIQWAIDRQWRYVCFEADCSVLIAALKGRVTQYQYEVGEIFQDCLDLISCFDKVEFTHIKRQGNAVADTIARSACHATEVCVWEENVPAQFRAVAMSDLV